MSDLRDRIANAIYEASDDYTRKLMVNPRLPGCSQIEGANKPVCYRLADAVIRELGLTVETTADKWIGGGMDFTRYVTEWRQERGHGA